MSIRFSRPLGNADLPIGALDFGPPAFPLCSILRAGQDESPNWRTLRRCGQSCTPTISSHVIVRGYPHPILLSVANKGLTAIWCASVANKGLSGFFVTRRRRDQIRSSAPSKPVKHLYFSLLQLFFGSKLAWSPSPPKEAKRRIALLQYPCPM